MKNISSILTLLFLLTLQCSCASLKDFFGGPAEPPKPAPMAKPSGPGAEVIKFSENPNLGAFNERRYRRITRKSLEEENDLGGRAGSLWNNEGPGSYLFTQNKLHREGDLLNIKLEGAAKNQLDTKMGIIKKLLARLEVKPTVNPPGANGLATNAGGTSPGAGENQERNPAALNGSTPAAGASGAATAGNSAGGSSANGDSGAKANENGAASDSSSGEDTGLPKVADIPTRVAERLADGTYRVKGQQSVFINKKEFKVILTGLIRPEDFTDEGVSSNKILDAQVDVVSLRRSIE